MADEKTSSEVDVIVANKRATDYLQYIDFKTLGKCVFRDHLATVSEAGKNIGELTISVEETVRDKMICYHVHAQSHGELDNVPMGTSVSAYISKGLVTLEQTQHEYIKFPNKPLDKKTVLLKNEDEYQIKRTICEGEETLEIEKSLTSIKGFISEGANIILQRVMSMREEVPERAVFLSLDVNLDICAMKYEQLEDRSLELEGEKHQIFGIQRLQFDKLYEPIMTWHTYFLRDGHMANRITLGSPVRMQLVSLPPNEDKDESEAHGDIQSKRELHWQEDIELHSKYLDRKEKLVASHTTYLSRRPEIRALLEDFCQFVLLRKPEDVCTFAADYFASFSTKIKAAIGGEENKASWES